MMKRMYWLIAVLLAAVLFLARCRKWKKPQCEEDGGVRHRIDTNAPKTILSNRIVSFSCLFSTLNLSRADNALAGRIFSLYAAESGGRYEARSREKVYEEKTFTPTPEFLAQLQQIVSQYDFARHNGQFYTVSGLPPDYGAKLEIRYDSGERIQASNNQSCFLSVEALEKLVELFQNA